MTRLPAHIGRDDLTSAGMAALVLSAQGYDESRGVPFARFAAIRIRGALVDELRSMDWASRSVRGRAREVDAARNQLSVTLGRSPRAHEVAETLGCQRVGAWQHRCGCASGQRAQPAGLRAGDRRRDGAGLPARPGAAGHRPRAARLPARRDRRTAGAAAVCSAVLLLRPAPDGRHRRRARASPSRGSPSCGPRHSSCCGTAWPSPSRQRPRCPSRPVGPAPRSPATPRRWLPGAT